MPTTPQSTNHSANTERKEFTITTSSASDHPEADPGDEPANGPYLDEEDRCPCGALAEGKGPCRKCRARAIWNRRQANRGRRFAQPSSRHPSMSRREGRGSSRPLGRRPGH
jgi:hypothetical protein